MRVIPGGDGGTAEQDATLEAGPARHCSEAASWIYLLTFTWVEEPVLGMSPGVSRADVVRFEPDKKTLTPLGELNCPGAQGPSSMAVDRSGHAWVYYQATDAIFRVNLDDLSCAATEYDGEKTNFGKMGMAFVADSQDAPDETLYIAGRVGTTDTGKLATLDTDTFEIDMRGEFDNFGELTGNGIGEVWAFRANMPPRELYELDKSNADILRTFSAAEIDTETSSGASGYAFAFWGGSYYLFYRSVQKHQADDTTTSGIWKLDPDTGEIEEVVEESGHTIVGAGVSTCAPVRVL
ncbi:MAG: hypothetical protein KC416_14875 [Myxococcales bacterium]|nr:hypothetical protein [Myxococcales bacterium]